jgi:hypothetical protein
MLFPKWLAVWLRFWMPDIMVRWIGWKSVWRGGQTLLPCGLKPDLF